MTDLPAKTPPTKPAVGPTMAHQRAQAVKAASECNKSTLPPKPSIVQRMAGVVPHERAVSESAGQKRLFRTLPATTSTDGQGMASSASHERAKSVQAGQKRKRDDGEADIKDEGLCDNADAKVDANSLIPDDYEPKDNYEDDENTDDVKCEDTSDQTIEYPTHNEDDEPFPDCAYYDDAIEDIETMIMSISQRVGSRLSAHDSNSKIVKAHLSTAESLSELPETKRIKIAILGGAGVGKSSLLNAVIGKHDLAKSLSGGQSCTCVPTEYQDAFYKQKCDFGAMIYYLKPQQVEIKLKETIKDYNTYAFEDRSDWDEDTRTTAKKAHENALRELRTLFNDLPGFKSKADTVRSLAESHESSDSKLLDELTSNCESKLKYTASKDYSEWHEASTVAKLRKLIDPLMTSTGGFEQPALWPLTREVSIGVRNSRVLEKVTLIDLPGISDTNQARVELTHDYIKTCDFVWVVAPISRVVDDGTVYQLLSRYGKAFKGMISVICTHSDEGIVGSELKLVNHFKQEDQDTTPFTVLNDKIKKKKFEISQLNTKINAIRKRKKALKAEIQGANVDDDKVKQMRQDCSRWEAERFEFLVSTRNALVVEQLQDSMQSHLPRGQRLEVHCISSYHYAALKGASISGPRLTTDSTGIPKLRSNTIALMAPRLLATLAHYIQFSTQVMLRDLQLWVNSTCIDRRPELLAMARKPQVKFRIAMTGRRNASKSDVKELVDDFLAKTIPSASEAALQQLQNKRKKHWTTIHAFLRKNGNHATRMCPKESWNENFSKFFAEAVGTSQAALAQAQAGHTTELELSIVDDLNKLKQEIQDFPAPLPKKEFAASIDTYIRGVHDAIESDTSKYAKDVRNILFDVTEDTEKNAFSCKMKPVYEECIADSGSGIIKRSMDTIEATLSDTGSDSPFTVAARRVSARLSDTDTRHMVKYVQPEIEGILDRLYTSVDNLLDNLVVDEAEAAAKKDLQGLLPIMLSDWKQSTTKFQAIKAKYERGSGKVIVLD